jgi:hypothetical protein
VAQLYPQALGSLSVASYDSQGYGGGIRTRLHAGTNYRIVGARVRVKSQSYFTTGGLPPVSSSWRQVPWGSRREVLFLQLNPCGHSSYVTVTSSLTRGWFGLLWICLAFDKCKNRTCSLLLKIFPFALTNSKSKLCYERQSLSVWSPHREPKSRFLLLSVSGLLMWGVLSDEVNWPCLLHLGTDRVDNTDSIMAVFFCCRGNMLIYGAVAYFGVVV